jgi:succinoglycan biosynthesis protein ExoM
MTTEPVRVDVCIATCKRPHLLRSLLESLASQRLSPRVTVRIIVVDNDRSESARAVVHDFAVRSPWPVVYDVEPERNISLARNRSVSLANGDYLAFIDDDETADERWLSELLGAMERYGADVVCGPVLPVLPLGAPAWACGGRAFERPRYASGASLSTGGAGNMFVDVRAVRRYPIPFDPAYGLSGGEDHDLCRRVVRDGGRIVWCDTAAVMEFLGPERLTLRYLARRSLNGGRVYARRQAEGRGIPGSFCWFFFRSAIAVTFALAVPLVWTVNRLWGIRLFMKMCSNLGQVSILIMRGDDFYAAD